MTAVALGAALAAVVWWGLLTAGGLNGGDTYSYFFPQKIVVAESFARGEIPLWHDLTGLGYPLHAESQAAVFYPSTQIFYRLLNVNAAYNANIILHYCLAFVFTWRFARCQQLTQTSALLCATVFVYGWFPARISLEWSIVGGVWLPLSLWMTHRLLQQQSLRNLGLLAACLSLHLLAGHFTLAFITQLTICSYAVLYRSTANSDASSRWTRRLGIVVAGIALGFTTAAIQVIPTFELKLSSQREGAGKAFDPAYGHMPPAYISQVVASWWYWHTPEVKNTSKIHSLPGSIDADTNAVEAHLYWGLIPLVLILAGLSQRLRSRMDGNILSTWVVLATCGLVYATGWLLPLTRHLPGFSFFMGPGRYTIVTALGGSLIAGLVFDAITRRWHRTIHAVLGLIIICITLPDLLASGRSIADAFVVSQPPLERLEQSWVRKALANSDKLPVRLLAPGPNVSNLYGVSCVPQYLGIGPAAYFTDQFRPDTQASDDTQLFPDTETEIRLEQLGITHVLSTSAIGKPSDKLRLIGQYPDAYLNSVWGRGSSSVYLYEFDSPAGRVRSMPGNALKSADFKRRTPGSQIIDVNLTDSACVQLLDLKMPGWTVKVDGQKAAGCDSNVLPVRQVSVPAGKHTIEWSYKPLSFTVGCVVSAIMWLAIVTFVVRGQAKSSAAI